MVVSDKYNFIFVHIPKTGGKSIRTILKDHIEISTHHRLENMNRNRIHAHLTLYEIRKYLNGYSFDNKGNVKPLQDPIKRFEGKKIFTVMRNPWDWVVSYYEFIKSRRRHPKYFEVNAMSFKDFIKSDYIKPQVNYVWNFTTNSIWPETKIIRFEDLQKGFNEMLLEVGLHQMQLPHLHKTKRGKYHEYYDEETKSLIANKFAKEIELLKYEF